jgi:hypothetical protein
MVCYIYDCNYVKVVPMKSRSASEWVKSYHTIHQELTVKGFKPKLQTLDNEASAALKNYLPSMISLTNWCHPIDIDASLPNVSSELSRNTFWPVSPRWTRLPIALVGQTTATSVNHVESSSNLETASTSLCRGAFSWSCGLQQNSFCSARMQNNCTRKTRKETHLGSPRAAWLLVGSRYASLPMSKCLHLGHIQ